MNERLLQYIWQHQLYNKQSLTTVTAEPLEILDRGIFNTNQGPDFLNGKVKVNGTTWVGQIELHIKGSDWRKHAHSSDRNYDNVVLHVVWENDEELQIPTLELESRVSAIVLERYRGMMRKNSFIPCENLLNQADPVLVRQTLDAMLLRRLNRRSERIGALLQSNGRHWEEVQWWMLARAFGGNINGDAFETIARSIPFNVLARHRTQIHQVEGLLLGQGGMLEQTFTDQYSILLQKEYRFLRKKYNLAQPRISLLFLRMRPQNFPTIRLAQLAMVMNTQPHLFGTILQLQDLRDLQSILAVTANDYWHYHFRLDEPSPYQPKTPGKSFIDSVILNAVLNVVYCYAKEQQDQPLLARVFGWLQSVPGEKNKTTDRFEKYGVVALHAGDSQSLLELHQFYCTEKRCLECTIGKRLLSVTPQG